MGKVGAAFRAFWRALRDQEFANRVEDLLAGKRLPAPEEKPAEPFKPAAAEQAPPARKPGRSEALSLLAALQRDARLIDFVKEDLSGYAAEQVKAAVLDVHRQCGQVLERMFAIEPLLPESEGSRVEVPAGFDPGKYRLTGNVSGEPPYNGTLAHHGWKATKCDVPEWTGSDEAAQVVGAAEVEV